MIEIIFFILIFCILSFVLKKVWLCALSEKPYRIIAFLGIVVHELSHFFACLLMGAKVEKVNLFNLKKGGYVVCGKPKIFLGKFFIGFAPILGSILLLTLFSNIFEEEQLLTFGFTNWKFWIFILFSSSIISYMVPSKEDLKTSLKGLIFVFSLLIILNYFNVFDSDFFVSLFEKIHRTLSVMISIEIIGILIGGIIFLLRKVLNVFNHI